MTQPQSVFSVYSRLALGHSQFLLLLASFRFDWPEAVKSFLSLFQSITDSQKEVFSLDCLLGVVSSLPPFYNLLLLELSLPLLGTLAIALVLWIRSKVATKHKFPGHNSPSAVASCCTTATKQIRHAARIRRFIFSVGSCSKFVNNRIVVWTSLTEGLYMQVQQQSVNPPH